MWPKPQIPAPAQIDILLYIFVDAKFMMSNAKKSLSKNNQGSIQKI